MCKHAIAIYKMYYLLISARSDYDIYFSSFKNLIGNENTEKFYNCSFFLQKFAKF